MRLFILMIFLIPSLCFADEYYVFIQTKDSPIIDAGQSMKGDVVNIAPFTPGNVPTDAEKSRYKIIVVDLTPEEVQALMTPKRIGDDDVSFRDKKIDIDKLGNIKQEEKVLKDDFQKFVIDSTVVVP